MGQARGPAARDDILDSLVRRMALCAEIGDVARRAECYDRVQKSPEAVAAQGVGAQPASPAPVTPSTYRTPPVATYVVVPGAEPRVEVNYPHKECHEHRINCAYDAPGHRPTTEAMRAGEVREINRSQGAAPPRDATLPLVSVRIDGLRDIAEKWQLTVSVSSAAPRTIDPSISCTLTNAGQSVSDITYTARGVRPGESVRLEMTGPSVTASYVDGATCRVLGPITLAK